MNRTTVLILALVLLLAHVLAMHNDSSGTFAVPNDLAHVDFRIARNAIHGQGTSWLPGGSAAAIAEEGGSSLLWIIMAMGAEAFAFSPARTASFVGIIAALLTLGCLARLSRARLIGVTATVLLVCSGPFAASASSGTETALATFLITLAFLAQERGRSVVLGLSLALAVLTRSDAAIMAAGMLGLALVRRRTAPDHLRLAPAFLPPLAAFATIIGIRVLHNAPALPPALAQIFNPDPGQIELGLWSLEALVRGTVAPLLVALPLLMFTLGKLGGTGRRALCLTVLGTVVIILGGASEAAMHVAFVPVLPLAFIAVQEAFIEALERRPKFEGAVWSALAVACLASTLASKLPGNIGPLPTKTLLEYMARENPVRKAAFGSEWNGRRGLARDLHAAKRMRAVGIFFRDYPAPDATVLTPWPGAIGYLSRLNVIDLLGRASAAPGEATAPWSGHHRADVVAALAAGYDYVVPMIPNRMRPPTQQLLIETWLTRFDSIGATPERRAAMALALEPYELVAVPTPDKETDLNAPAPEPAFLLRRRALNLAPTVTAEITDAGLQILATHIGHHQIAELEVRATTAAGFDLYLRPTGLFTSGSALRARAEILLFPTGDRQINLITTELPSQLAGATLRVRMLNPFSDPDDPLAEVGETVTIQVPERD